MVSIAAANFARFGKREEDIFSIASESALPLLDKFRDSIDFVVVSNSYSGEFNDISGLNNLLTTHLGMDSVPSLRVDNTSGSGGSAVLVAKSLVASGEAQNVLVIGAEKMTRYPTKRSTRIIASLLPPEERRGGPSLPSLAAFMTRSYIREFSPTRESIARVAVKNHHNGSLNPYAHFQAEVTLEKVMTSKVIADPLRIFEYCPVSDGAVSLLVTSDDNAASFGSKAVRITGTGASSGVSSITSRESLVSIDSVKESAVKAFRSAGKTPGDMDIAELHDMASILEIVESEDVGFFRKGEGWKALESGETTIEGRLPINTSGGLNSKGHPIGASGVAQSAEIFLQLTGQAGKRQVKNASTGFSVSMAGFGNNSTSFVYEVA
jgi:acetyl-CoA acetyltransferase